MTGVGPPRVIHTFPKSPNLRRAVRMRNALRDDKLMYVPDGYSPCE